MDCVHCSSSSVTSETFRLNIFLDSGEDEESFGEDDDEIGFVMPVEVFRCNHCEKRFYFESDIFSYLEESLIAELNDFVSENEEQAHLRSPHLGRKCIWLVTGEKQP